MFVASYAVHYSVCRICALESSSFWNVCSLETRFHTAIMELSFCSYFCVCVCVCSEGRMATQAAKLKCVLCYFQRVAEDRCNLSSVITLRRQVQLLASFFSLSLLLSLSLPLSPSLPLSLSPSPPLTLSLFPPILRKCIGPGFKSIQLKFASYKMLALSSFLLPVRLVL